MIRAYITEDFPADAVKIAIVQQPEDGRPQAILRVIDDAPRLRWEAIEPDTTIEPTMMLREDEARALLDSLTRHFQGAEDTRALRRDYDSERARVDGLTGALIDVARMLAAPAHAVNYEMRQKALSAEQQRELLKRLTKDQDVCRGG